MVEIIEAFAQNESYDKMTKKVIIQEHFEPYIVELAWKYYKYSGNMLMRLIEALDKFEYYHSDLLFKLIQAQQKLEINQ